MINSEEFNFNFDPSQSDNLIKIYEHFLELGNPSKASWQPETDDLGVMPKKEWYTSLQKLIEDYGYENYRIHAKETLESVIKLQAATEKLKRLKKIDNRKGIWKNTRDYILDIEWNTLVEGPTEFYFYCSEKGRYLKGMILSIGCIPDPILLKLIEKFAIECPFQVSGHSQAPMGLYVYDALEVFSMLEYPKSIPYIMNFKARIKQTWAQEKFDKYLQQIAKKQKIDFEEIIEIAISDYGFNHENIFEKELGIIRFKFRFRQAIKNKFSG